MLAACAVLLLAIPEPAVSGEGFLVHRFESACNSYLVTCTATKRFAVVDPAFDLVPHVEAWIAEGHEPAAVWLTHEHGDHVTGLAAVLGKWKLPVVLHADAKKGLAGLAEHWADWGFPAEVPAPPVPPDDPVADGARVELGELVFTAIHVPGHTPGSLCYLLKDRALLCGDVLFRGSVGRTDLPGSDPDLFAQGLSKRLWDLPDAVAVLPGHGPGSTIGGEKRANWLFQDLVRAARGEEPIVRPWLGIELDREHPGPGARLLRVVGESPAANAGLREGDVILGFGGAELKEIADLGTAFRTHGVGDRIPLRVRRGGETLEIELVLGARPR